MKYTKNAECCWRKCLLTCNKGNITPHYIFLFKKEVIFFKNNFETKCIYEEKIIKKDDVKFL